jgi:hypothetical protein
MRFPGDNLQFSRRDSAYFQPTCRSTSVLLWILSPHEITIARLRCSLQILHQIRRNSRRDALRLELHQVSFSCRAQLAPLLGQLGLVQSTKMSPLQKISVVLHAEC